MSNLVGDKTGPANQRGNIGSKLSQAVETVPVVDFVPIPNRLFLRYNLIAGGIIIYMINIKSPLIIVYVLQKRFF